MIYRQLVKNVENRLFKGKALIIIGARQVGKTTLINQIAKSTEGVLRLNADNQDTRVFFENPNTSWLKKDLAGVKLLIIDEAQQIPDIGRKLKLITDELQGVQLIATGSSAFEISNKLNEPLTGRKFEYIMFPVSVEEMINHHGAITEHRLLKHRLIYGFYPEIITAEGDEVELLSQLVDSYLFKDILMLGNLMKSDKLVKLLQALAFQLGNQVSYHELGKIVGLSSETVENYILLLEQSFIVFRLPTYSRNPRNELTKTRKVYFYDNGVRNALIANYNQIDLRQDVGALWENFMISERMKYLNYNKIRANRFFWRTKAQQEVDYLEEREGNLYGYEFKWNPLSKGKITKAFTNAYPNAITQLITNENYMDFITE